MRSYGETIDVRVGPGRSRTGHRAAGPATAGAASTVAHPDPSGQAAGPDPSGPGGDEAPVQFLWRGRLYLVRDVLAHWVELGTWWTRAARPSAGPGPDGSAGRSVAADVGAVEREVWRVEAASGRTATVGVFDLVRDVRAVDPGSAVPPPVRWRLARALD